MELTHVPHPYSQRNPHTFVQATLRPAHSPPCCRYARKAMKTNNGIGLAANQVGRPEAIFVIDEKLAEEYGVPSVFANREIGTDDAKESDQLEEGCLSIVGLWTDVRRSKRIMFKALDGEGNKVKFRARGMLARVLQHETDHLNGVTIAERSKKPLT